MKRKGNVELLHRRVADIEVLALDVESGRVLLSRLTRWESALLIYYRESKQDVDKNMNTTS